MLTHEPFGMSIAQIANLTDYQLRAILFAPDPIKAYRDKKKAEQEAKQMTYKEAFWFHWRNHGKTDEEIQKRWDARNAR